MAHNSVFHKSPSIILLLLIVHFIFFSISFGEAQIEVIKTIPVKYNIYPQINDSMPKLSSPFQTVSGEEFVIAYTKGKKYPIIQVTMSNNRGICK